MCACAGVERNPLASREAQDTNRNDLLTKEQFRERFGQDNLDEAIA